MPTTPTERLDVEDDAQRELRLRQLLERTNNNNSSRNRTALSNTPALGPSSFTFGVGETHVVEPPTQLLARVEAFLPQMEAANAELVRRMENCAESVDIEDVEDAESGQIIEMNLGLGVFDIRPSGDSGRASPTSSDASSSDDSDSSDDDPTDSDSHRSHSDSDASTSVIGGPHITPAQRPIRPLPNRRRNADSSQNKLSDNADH